MATENEGFSKPLGQQSITPHTPMNIDETGINKGKRVIEQSQTSDTETTTTTQQENTHQPDKQQHKKPFMSHGIRRAKSQIRFDFLNATNKHEAFEQWSLIMNKLRTIDTTLILHTAEENVAIHITDPLPSAKNSQPYAAIEEIKKRTINHNMPV
jgi:hypothetical protein